MSKKKDQISVQELFEELQPHKQSLPLQWDDDIGLKIMELEPLMVFFRENFRIPTKIEVENQIQQVFTYIKKFSKNSKDFTPHMYLIHYEEHFKPPAREFTLTSLHIFPVCSLKFQPNVYLSMKYLCFKDGLANDIALVYSENSPDIFPIRFNGTTYWQSVHWSEEDYKEIKKELSKSEIKELENSEYIENLKFEQPDYAKFGLWEFKELEFYFDKNFHFYSFFSYYDEEREAYLTGFVPISKEKLGEFYYYCKKVEDVFGIYIVAL